MRGTFRAMGAFGGWVQDLSASVWRVLLVALLIAFALLALSDSADGESQPGSRSFQAPDQSTVPPTQWTCDGLAATIVGTPDGETLTGTSSADVIVAREGNDIILGLGGDDVICAGKGNDVVYGGAGFDILFGAQGNDSLYSADGPTANERADSRGARMFGGADSDKIYGSNKWDRMQGGPGNDQLFGYEGRDWLRAGPGNDAVDGGAGIDDQHGGNGRDDIEVTQADIVRGGAGLDLCRVTGEPALLRSCGRNVRESPLR